MNGSIGSNKWRRRKYEDRDYILFDPFEGDRDVDVRARTVKIVTIRKEHPCGGNSRHEWHILPVGHTCSLRESGR
jgi:hypothetical protein